MKWHHGHSLGIGSLMGLSLASHGWLILTLGLAAGWLARDVYSGARFLARRLAR